MNPSNSTNQKFCERIIDILHKEEGLILQNLIKNASIHNHIFSMLLQTWTRESLLSPLRQLVHVLELSMNWADWDQLNFLSNNTPVEITKFINTVGLNHMHKGVSHHQFSTLLTCMKESFMSVVFEKILDLPNDDTKNSTKDALNNIDSESKSILEYCKNYLIHFFNSLTIAFFDNWIKSTERTETQQALENENRNLLYIKLRNIALFECIGIPILVFNRNEVILHSTRIARTMFLSTDIADKYHSCPGNFELKLSNFFSESFLTHLSNSRNTSDSIYEIESNQNTDINAIISENFNDSNKAFLSFSTIAHFQEKLQTNLKETGNLSSFDCILTAVVDISYQKPYEILVLYDMEKNLEIQRLNYESEVLNEMNKFKDRLLRTTSHELLTPIHGINGMVESLIAENPNKEILLTLSCCAQHLSYMVRDILDYQISPTTKLNLQKTYFHINCVLNNAHFNTRFCFEQKKLSLISKSIENIIIHADFIRITQVLINILRNAVKYTPTGGSVSISTRIIANQNNEENSFLEISIIDNGIGILPEMLDPIFSYEHYKNPSVHSNTESWGIGLSLCKSIIEQHEGKIWAENRQDGIKGSIFRFTLPYFQNKETLSYLDKHLDCCMNIRTVHNNKRNLEVDNALSPKRQKIVNNKNAQSSLICPVINNKKIYTDKQLILTIDDDPLSLNIISLFLKNTSYTLETFTDPDKGLNYLQKMIEENKRPGCVIIDYMMPGKNGFEATSIIRTFPNCSLLQLPVILMSAGMIHNPFHAFEAGANDVLNKPFKKFEFLAKLKSVLSFSRAFVYFESVLHHDDIQHAINLMGE